MIHATSGRTKNQNSTTAATIQTTHWTTGVPLASELTKLLGEARSELFHYEVRATYDTPEVAESRRIVNDAIQQAEQRNTWQSSEGTEDGDDAPEW